MAESRETVKHEPLLWPFSVQFSPFVLLLGKVLQSGHLSSFKAASIFLKNLAAFLSLALSVTSAPLTPIFLIFLLNLTINLSKN